MSENDWTVKNSARLAENQQQAAEMLCTVAENVPDGDTFANRIRAISREVDRHDAALTALYQNIRSIVGPVDVTEVDREAVTEEDAANGLDAREYYAERWALLRTMREHDGKYHNLRILLERHHIDIVSDFANSMRILETKLQELKDVQTVLTKAGWNVKNHDNFIAAIDALVENYDEQLNKQAPIQQQDSTPLDHYWSAGRTFDIPVSLPLLRGLTAIIAEPMRGGPPSVLTRRQRIIRMYHALLALAATHGVLLDEHANDDLSEDGPVFDG